MKWNNLGLNIFLSVKVSEIPQELYSFTPEQKKKNLCLIGHGGKYLWEQMRPTFDSNQHPFDQYTINQIQLFTKDSIKGDCEILFPNNAYRLPLQKIGRFLNFCTQSPIGLDISEEFGLWFAFRGVFLTSENITTAKLSAAPEICINCLDRPCLKSASIDLARLSCPIKTEHQYSKDQREYHNNSALNHVLRAEARANNFSEFFNPPRLLRASAVLE